MPKESIRTYIDELCSINPETGAASVDGVEDPGAIEYICDSEIDFACVGFDKSCRRSPDVADSVCYVIDKQQFGS